MFGLQLRREEWVLLAVALYVLVRVAFAVGQVVGRWALDGPPPQTPQLGFALASAFAASAALCAGASLALDNQPRGARYALYAASVVIGPMIGFVADLSLAMRLSRLSLWLASFRLPVYRDQLTSSDPAARLIAAKRIFELGTYAAPAVPDLVAASKDEFADVRGFALLGLLYEVHEDPEVIAAARSALSDPDERVRAAAAMVLVKCEKGTPDEVLPALSAGVMLVEEPFASLAAGAFGELGEAAAPAVGALRAAIFDRDPPNGSAIFALQHLGEAAVPVLVEVLRRGSNLDRQTAAWSLASMGEKAAPALPALRDASNSQDVGVSAAAKTALEKLGADRR
ncbi:MAG TPA: HEAT repeat domain-containing protein [Gemmataceae bacterium]|nr:HEAT repeat domain-containing protein [Gemmataceae bacterium]